MQTPPSLGRRLSLIARALVTFHAVRYVLIESAAQDDTVASVVESAAAPSSRPLTKTCPSSNAAANGVSTLRAEEAGQHSRHEVSMTEIADPLAAATAAGDAFGRGPLQARAARARPRRPRFRFETRSAAHRGSHGPKRRSATKRSR